MVASDVAPRDGRARTDGGNGGDHWSIDASVESGGLGQRLADLFDDLLERIAPSPWGASAGRSSVCHCPAVKHPLYTAEERERRDASPWTTVQAVLAPLQFLAFAVSLVLVVRYLATGAGYEAATISILAKTVLLYTIMVTGSVWEKRVFGKWLFARTFFWEDVFSLIVLALQTAYLCALVAGLGSPREQMAIAIAAYATYVINATQFLLKLRAARREAPSPLPVAQGRMGQVA
jgi:3-vinyl bacteriochlorophyllide hydratase